MVFRYKPTATKTPPINKRIKGGQILSGKSSVINLGKFTTKPKPPTKKIICSDNWILAQTRITDPKINKIISNKTLSPTKSVTRIIVPIEIVVDDKKYPSQLGFKVFEYVYNPQIKPTETRNKLPAQGSMLENIVFPIDPSRKIKE